MLKIIAGLMVMLSFWAGAQDWQSIEQKAKGQTVYFNAWGGGDNINAYIRWAGEQVKQRYGVELKHVKVSETAAVVSRILAEKAAGRDVDGSVDLVWINGENFRALKQAELLYGPFTPVLPNTALTNAQSPALQFDFSVPVEGLEAPWGGAQLTFYHDSQRLPEPPRSMQALAEYLSSNKGLFAYPAPPNFYGTTFIKQAMIELSADPAVFAQPVDEAAFAAQTEALWPFLDQLHGNLWRGGKTFPSGIGQVQQLVNDGELAIGFTFNPNDPAASVEQGLLPESIRTYVHDKGTIANTHFVAIPYNSSAKEGAMVVANFLMSPEAQARKQDLNYWGDPSILALDKLSAEQLALFKGADHTSALSAEQRSNVLPEPHASWVELLEAEWQKRYGQ